MKISVIGTDIFWDPSTGRPLEGRLSVFLRDSSNLATTYTLEGSSFVQAANPVLVHGGHVDDSLFADAAVYRILVERYTGPEGGMLVDGDPMYFEAVDVFEVGFDYDSAMSDAHTVEALDDLQGASPDLKTVTVIGYNAPGDCVPRTYIWDASSQDNIDGGYVVGSDLSDTGRWILLWGDEIIPASVYGVFPGSEQNMNALLGYPATVGSFALKTAPCVRFTAGDYTSTTNFATDKELVFDSGTRFVAATLTCPRVQVLGRTLASYVGNFVLTATDAVAHSSWFRTLYGFWACGAKRLELDSTNFFEESVIHGNVSLSNKVVSGTGRIPCTYESGRYFVVAANTTINGRIFGTTDYVRVMTDGWGDGIFARDGSWDPGLISEGHHVQFDTVPDLDLFESTERWVATMVERRARLNEQAWDDFTLDLQNRRLDSINVGKFTEIRNGTFKRLAILNSSADVTLRNVTAFSITLSCRYISIYDSDVSFDNVVALSAIWGYGSRISSATAWTDPNVQCIFERCYIGINFQRVTENDNDESLLRFVECNLQANANIQSKRLEMFRCLTDNNSIKIYPHKENGAYHISAVLEGNTFNSTEPVEFTRVEVINGWVQEECYNIILDWKIVDNSFSGNAEGIRMRYWQKRTGQYYTRTFVKMDATAHNVQYSGNKGMCPRDTMVGISISDGAAYVTESVGTQTVYKYPTASTRCMSTTAALWWTNHPIDREGTIIKWFRWTTEPFDPITYSVFAQPGYFVYQKAHDEINNDGDFFMLAVLVAGDFIRIVQGGGHDRDRGVTAKIV